MSCSARSHRNHHRCIFPSANSRTPWCQWQETAGMPSLSIDPVVIEFSHCPGCCIHLVPEFDIAISCKMVPQIVTELPSVQSPSHIRLFATPWIAAHQASLSITNSWSSLRLTSIEWVSDAIQPSHPLSSPSSPAPNPSQHQSLFQWVNSSHEVAKVLEFQL